MTSFYPEHHCLSPSSVDKRQGQSSRRSTDLILLSVFLFYSYFPFPLCLLLFSFLSSAPSVSVSRPSHYSCIISFLRRSEAKHAAVEREGWRVKRVLIVCGCTWQPPSNVSQHSDAPQPLVGGRGKSYFSLRWANGSTLSSEEPVCGS